MQLMPGVVQEPPGALHVNGSSENQVLYLLNGFDITDPISGHFQTSGGGRHPLDRPFLGPLFAGVRKGIGRRAGHRHREGHGHVPLHGHRFIPGVQTSSKACTSETGIRGSASPDQSSADAPGSPILRFRSTRSAGDRTSKRPEHSQWMGRQQPPAPQANATPSNILFVDFLVNVDNEGRVGLGPLNPGAHNFEYAYARVFRQHQGPKVSRPRRAGGVRLCS